jgi:DNA-binding transcriptional regulator YhcF (GntR family)
MCIAYIRQKEVNMDYKLDDNMPIYIQIMQKVRDAIASGEWTPGQKIPSVRELAALFEVNPNTMQRAMLELEREGLLVSERTVGRFVTEDRKLIRGLKKDVAIAAADTFRSAMLELGYTPEEMIEFFRARNEELMETETKVG